MREFEGMFVCIKNYDLKLPGANWELVEHTCQSEQRFPVSERTMKEFEKGKNPYIRFFCGQCEMFHEIPVSMIFVKEKKGGDQNGDFGGM
jgi:hypothetical protein